MAANMSNTVLENTLNKVNEETMMWSFLQNFKPQTDFAVLILNQPILCDPQFIKSLWNKADLRVLVDGGSNRWLDFLREDKISDVKLPDFLSGDFDSIKPETKTHFEGLKVNFIHTPDQDATDFTKALKCVKDHSQAKNLDIKLVLAVCENFGRFDQIIANINTLHLSNKVIPNTPVITISSESISWLLHPGKHTIRVTEEFVEGQYCCGLIPFCGPTLVTTSGLKWNLENQTMEFGSLVSTSNTYSDKEISISCNKDLVWTTQYSKIVITE